MKEPLAIRLVANRYRVLQRVGEGGMGIVYLAIDHLADESSPFRRVALKFLPSTATPTQIEAFRREFSLLSGLRHPHLIRVLDFGLDRARNQYFFTARFVEGKNLYAVTRKKSIDEILPFFLALTDVLDFVHGHGILHNDLKPSNILTENGNVQVLDFGVSTLRDPRMPGHSLGGTQGYTATEVLAGFRPTVASDLFSLGVVFHKVLVGCLPAGSSLDPAKRARRRQPQPPRSPRFPRTLPLSFRRLLERLLAPTPSKRPQSAGEVYELLAAIAKERGRRSPIKPAPEFLVEGPYLGHGETLHTILEIIGQSKPVSPPSEVRVIRISGRSGSGKSRLLAEIRKSLQLADISLCFGSFHTTRSAPYQAFSDLFPQLEVYAPSPPSEGHAFLKTVFDARLAGSPGRKQDREFVAEHEIDEQFRLFYHYAQFLQSVSCRQPLVILLDDLDLANLDSLSLFRLLLRRAPKHCVFLVTHDTEISPELQVIFETHRDDHFALNPFSAAELQDYLQYFFPGLRFDPEVLRHILRLSQGQPGSIQEVTQGLVHAQWIHQRDRHWHCLPSLGDKLESIQHASDLLKSQIRDFKGRERGVLFACTLFFEPFLPDDVGFLVGLSRSGAHGVLMKALAAGLVKEGKGGCFEWAHDRAKRLLMELIPTDQAMTGRMKAWHKKWAEHLIALQDPARIPEIWQTAVRHFHAAGDQRNVHLWYLRIGQEHLRRSHMAQAEFYLLAALSHRNSFPAEMAKQLLEQLVDLYFRKGQTERARPYLEELTTQAQWDQAEVSRYFLRLIVAHRNQGRYEAALQLAREGMERSGKMGANPLRARFLAQHAFCQTRLGNHAVALTELDQALSFLKGFADNLARAVLLNLRGTVRLEGGGSPRESLADFRNALSLFEELQDRHSQAVTWHNLGIAYSRLEREERALEAYERALELARSVGDFRRVLFALHSTANLHFRNLRLGQARDAFRSALDLAQILEDPLFEARLLLVLGRIFHLMGDFERARVFLGEGEQKLSRLENPRSFGGSLLALCSLHLSLGDADSAETALLRITARYPGEPAFQILAKLYSAEIAATREDWVHAETMMQDVLTTVSEHVPSDLLLESYCVHFRMQWRRQLPPDPLLLQRAKDLLDRLRPKENLLQWLSASLVLFRASVERRTGVKDVLLDFRKFQESWEKQILQLPEMKIEFQLLRTHMLLIQERWDQGFAALEDAEQCLAKIAPHSSQKAESMFMQAPLSREVRALRAHLIAISDPVVRKWSSLEGEIDLARKFLDAETHLLRNSFGLSSLLIEILKTLRSLLDLPMSYLYWKTPENEVLFEARKNAPVKGYGPSELLTEPADWVFRSVREIDENTVKGEFCFRRLDLPAETDCGAPAERIILAFQRSERPLSAQGMLEAFLQVASHLVVQEKAYAQRQDEIRLTTTETSHLRTRLSFSERSLGAFPAQHGFIGGRSLALRRTMQLVERSSSQMVTVLLMGESGTGKEWIARIIHALSPLSEKPFVVIDCATMSPQTFESQLFGHVRGAFTGAISDHAGILTTADGGTIFLDEVAEIPLAAQAKLLHFLQEGTFTPLGSSQSRTVKVRVIAATRHNLLRRVEAGGFRQELYYRLNVIQIALPPLRERREDIPDLANHFLNRGSVMKDQPPKKFTDRALRALCYAPWPGNVRQLEHLILTLVSMHPKQKRFDLADLPKEFSATTPETPVVPLAHAKEQFMRQYLSSLLQFTRGSVSEAARLSGIPRPYLHEQIKRFGKEPH